MKSKIEKYDVSNVLLLILCLILALQLFIATSFVIITFAVFIFCAIKKYKITCALLILLVYTLKCFFILKKSRNNSDTSSLDIFEDDDLMHRKTPNNLSFMQQLYYKNKLNDLNETKTAKTEKEKINEMVLDEIKNFDVKNKKNVDYIEINQASKGENRPKIKEVLKRSIVEVDEKEERRTELQNQMQEDFESTDDEEMDIVGDRLNNSKKNLEYFNSSINGTTYFDHFRQYNNYDYIKPKYVMKSLNSIKNKDNDKNNALESNKINYEHLDFSQKNINENSRNTISNKTKSSLSNQDSEHVSVVKNVSYVVF